MNSGFAVRACALTVACALSGAAFGQIGYSAIGGATDFLPFPGPVDPASGFPIPVADDVRSVLSGDVFSISVAALSLTGQDVLTDSSVFLARDNGDGLLQVDGTDEILSVKALTGLTISSQLTIIEYVLDAPVSIAANEQLWIAVNYTSPLEVGTVLYGDPPIGSSDELLYIPFVGGVPSPGAQDPGTYPNSTRMGFRINMVPTPGAVGLLAGAGMIASRRRRAV